jgi:hypothetical protein
MRKIVAAAAGLGFLAALYIFVASFFGLTMDPFEPQGLLIFLGIVVIAVPKAIVDRGPRWVSPFDGKPRWALRSMQVLFVLFVGLFIAFLVLGHGAFPKIFNGEYVLDSHGKIVGYLSARDYFFLKGWELRLFASGWMTVYFALMVHWWFPPLNEWNVVMPD